MGENERERKRERAMGNETHSHGVGVGQKKSTPKQKPNHFLFPSPLKQCVRRIPATIFQSRHRRLPDAPEAKNKPFTMKKRLADSQCGEEVREYSGTGLKAEIPSWVNKSSPWGTVFPGTL